jgi:hypothetical protein
MLEDIEMIRKENEELMLIIQKLTLEKEALAN